MSNEELLSRGLLTRDLANLDTFFGPRAFRNDKKIRALFLQRYRLILGKSEAANTFFNQEEFSNIQFFPLVQALKKGIKVQSVEVQFTYPVIQKENETVGAKSYFIMKRKLQRMSILVALMHFLSYLEKKKKKSKPQ